MKVRNNNISIEIRKLLDKTPGMSVKEIAKLLDIDRHFISGFLSALEERREVFSRKIGPAKIYFNHPSHKR
ncbi:MAG: hypothetical protein QXP36_07930 [Conexivisphaerales archaeon]